MNFYLIDKIHNDQNSVLKMHLLLKLKLENILKFPKNSSKAIENNYRKEMEIYSTMSENTKKLIVI